jgi:hypothetical protein
MAREFLSFSIELSRGFDEDARLAGDQGVAETRRGTLA